VAERESLSEPPRTRAPAASGRWQRAEPEQPAAAAPGRPGRDIQPAPEAVDLSSPYPFLPGQAVALAPAELLEVLHRYYGSGLPETVRLQGLGLPGAGRFELDLWLEAEGWPGRLRLSGHLEAHDGLARVVLQQASEPGGHMVSLELLAPLLPGARLDAGGALSWTAPLPVGMDDLRLDAGRALANGLGP
jgi:hypothetical protein